MKLLIVLLTCRVVFCASYFHKEYNAKHFYGIAPSQDGYYFLAGVNNVIPRRTGDLKDFKNRSFKAYGETIYSAPLRKFNYKLISDDKSEVVLDENGFFLNGKLLCGYDPLYRDHKHYINDKRIFVKECADKYNLYSWGEGVGVNIGFKVEAKVVKVRKRYDITEFYYVLNKKKFYLKKTQSYGYDVKQIYKLFDRSEQKSRHVEYQDLLTNFKECVSSDNRMCLGIFKSAKESFDYKWIRYRSLSTVVDDSEKGKAGPSRKLAKALVSCGVKRISDTFSKLEKIQYYEHVFFNCFKKEVKDINYRDIVAAASYGKKSFLRINTENLSLTFLKNSSKADSKWDLLTVNLTGRLYKKMTTTNITELKSINCDESPEVKKECDFWTKEVKTKGYDIFKIEPENIPTLSRKEFDILMKRNK